MSAEKPARRSSASWGVSADAGTERHNSGVSLGQITWLLTVVASVVAALLLLLNGYVGYFGVLLAVGASAAINLR
jgi:hypothetical protein